MQDPNDLFPADEDAAPTSRLLPNEAALLASPMAAPAGGPIDFGRILIDRPDVLRGFYEAFYGAGNDRNSEAWAKRVGGDTAEAYAKYWYERYGLWEGYSQDDRDAAEAIDVERLFTDRPDVFRAFFEEFYGENNDRKSSAWADRVGGETVEDYARYWYVTYGRGEGYTQHGPATGGPAANPDPEGQSPPAHDPAEDPWNHQAIFPDWKPPHEGWEPPPNIWHDPAAAASLFEPDVLA